MSGAMRDITLAHAATNAAASLLADIDWDGLLDDCHHAMALLADGNCPPGLDPVEAMATTRHNMAAINASRRYVREMRGIAEAADERETTPAGLDVEDAVAEAEALARRPSPRGGCHGLDDG